MSGFRIEGNTTGNVAEITSDNEVLVRPTLAADKSGFTALVVEEDNASVTGTRTRRRLRADHDNRLKVAEDGLFLSESFPGSTINSSTWNLVGSTMANTVTGGFAVLNSGSSVSVGANSRLSSFRSFPVIEGFAAKASLTMQFSVAPQVNNTVEWGLLISTAGVAAPTDGVFFRLMPNGEFRAVVNNNGTESQSAALDPSLLLVSGASGSNVYAIEVSTYRAIFYVNNEIVANILRPSAIGGVVMSRMLPLCVRTYNAAGSGPSTAQVVRVGSAHVAVIGLGSTRNWSQVKAGMGDLSSQGPTGGTMGSTAALANSQAPGAGSAASNALSIVTGLGGQVSVQPTLTTNTDGILCSYQVPIGTAALPGKALLITGLRVSAVVTTALVGGPVISMNSLAFGHTAAGLTTVENNTTGAKAPRRVPLPIQTFAMAAAVGTQADRDIAVSFATPVLVQPGEFVQFAMKNVGTVTTTGVITYSIAFDGYWE